ncbi:hypothetical protein ACO2RV_16950 [Ancylobacter sp. VNQ12]|uniref:hypothetical protein n=1 Tax=Ancylobacter sp. VNQ12 TaxID=3400920 RepID=UPI003BFEBB95
MSAGKHTKGEWRPGVMSMSAKDWAQLRGDEITIVRRGQDVIAAVWCGDDRDGEEEANAGLISAAKDLLAAAKECLDAEQKRAKKLLPGAPASTYCAARLERIQAAIAKAEGRS